MIRHRPDHKRHFGALEDDYLVIFLHSPWPTRQERFRRNEHAAGVEATDVSVREQSAGGSWVLIVSVVNLAGVSSAFFRREACDSFVAEGDHLAQCNFDVVCGRVVLD